MRVKAISIWYVVSCGGVIPHTLFTFYIFAVIKITLFSRSSLVIHRRSSSGDASLFINVDTVSCVMNYELFVIWFVW